MTTIRLRVGATQRDALDVYCLDPAIRIEHDEGTSLVIIDADRALHVITDAVHRADEDVERSDDAVERAWARTDRDALSRLADRVLREWARLKKIEKDLDSRARGVILSTQGTEQTMTMTMNDIIALALALATRAEQAGRAEPLDAQAWEELREARGRQLTTSEAVECVEAARLRFDSCAFYASRGVAGW